MTTKTASFHIPSDSHSITNQPISVMALLAYTGSLNKLKKNKLAHDILSINIPLF